MKSRLTTFISILLVALFCLELANTLFQALYAQSPANNDTAVSPQSPASSWYNQLVHQETAGVSTSIMVDSSGHPHISYTSWEGLRHAFWTGSTWISQTVDPLDAGYYNSIAIDSNGRPHIAYLGSTGSNQAAVKYARWTGALWSIEVVSIVIHVSDVSLVLDNSDQPHISYFEGGDGTGSSYPPGLKYARWTGGEWEIELVDDLGFWYLSIDLDSAGNPHIAYLDQVNSDLRYAHKEGNTWDIQVVDFEGAVGGYNSITIDTVDHPHISYQDATSRFLKYAYWDGNEWVIETLEIGGWNSSMALDVLGRSHIIHLSYYLDGPLKHTYRDGNNWKTEIIAEAADRNGATSVASSADGYLHVSYFSAFPEIDIWYARTLPLLDLEKSASSIVGVPVGAELTYTLTLTGPGVSVNLLDPLPPNVEYITGTLTYPAVYSPTIHAILWQGTLSDTSQTFEFKVVPTVGLIGDPDLSIPIVNSAWLTDTVYPRAAFEMIIVNGWHQYLPVVLNP